MRCAYIAQDRPDLSETCRHLAQGMSDPKTGDLTNLKRLARYLIHKPRAVVKFPVSYGDNGIVAVDCYTDADWPGDPVHRKSVSGMAVLRANGLIKHSSLTQTAVGLSSMESEFYALCRGAATGLGILSFLRDLGVGGCLTVWSDSSAARSVASRRGIGKVRHLQVRYLWAQEAVSSK